MFLTNLPKFFGGFNKMTHICVICPTFASKQKPMETRQKVIDAAIRLFNNDNAATLEQVATAAGVSRRTLHRYFTSRENLLSGCYAQMLDTWQSAVISSYDNASTPLVQLEQLLYTAIDCGTKFTFLMKLQPADIKEDKNTPATKEQYEQIRDSLFKSIALLQKQGVIHDQLPRAWIRALFITMVSTTVTAASSGDIAGNQIKKLAWYSFSRSIGIH